MTSVGLDIGCITNECPSQTDIDKYFNNSHIPMQKTFPKNCNNETFPAGILKFHKWNTNGEAYTCIRDWLVCSRQKQALYCLPCRLFCHKFSTIASKSSFVRHMTMLQISLGNTMAHKQK